MGHTFAEVEATGGISSWEIFFQGNCLAWINGPVDGRLDPVSPQLGAKRAQDVSLQSKKRAQVLVLVI